MTLETVSLNLLLQVESTCHHMGCFVADVIFIFLKNYLDSDQICSIAVHLAQPFPLQRSIIQVGVTQGLSQDFKNAYPKQQFQKFCPSRFSYLST